jgi:hypothetical protein
MEEKESVLKYIAFYLPQFHPIKENNEWWGEGFTEWTNTKKAVPLFVNHRQPREPLNDNYYDLMDVRAHEWQSELMQKYNVYGLCYYHYWFCGKMLLEKPAELLLQHKEINTHFCFSWANEPWTRNWDGWDYSVLMPQNYGTEEDWKRHFEYLLPFFKDDRYIKIEGKPLFVLYVSGAIDRCSEMIACWRRLAQENRLAGLYIAETLNSKHNQNMPHLKDSDACIEFEPTLTLFGGYTHWNSHQYILNTLHTFSYDTVWNTMLERKSSYGSREKFCGAFVDWDNSSRVGLKSSVCMGADPDKFKAYLKRLTQKCIDDGNDRFIFVNAWNEWAEGAYLEPDKQYAYRYLQAIKEVSDEITLKNNF